MEGNRPFMPPPPPPPQQTSAPQQNAGPDFSYTQALPQEKQNVEKKQKEKKQKEVKSEQKQNENKKKSSSNGKGFLVSVLFLISAVVALGLVIIFVLYRDRLF